MADDTNTHASRTKIESNAILGHYPLLSWRSVLGGLLVSLLAYGILISLGLGVGGVGLNELILNPSEGGGGGLAIGSGIWLLLSTLIALFVGSFFAARLSNFVTGWVGMAHGLIIASLFFVLMLSQVMATLAVAGRGIGSAVGSVGGAATDMVSNPVVQDTLQDAFADRDLRSDPGVVAQGIAVRLLRGDTKAARNYLAYQARMSRPEADQKIAQVQNQFQAAIAQAGSAAAKTISAAGWTLFALLLLGAGASAWGGSIGTRRNFRRPLSDMRRTSGVGLGAPTLQP